MRNYFKHMGLLVPPLFEVFEIFSKAYEIFSRSRKTLISIALLSSFTYFTLHLLEYFIFTEPFVSDYSTNQTNKRVFEEGFNYLFENFPSLLGDYIDSMKDIKGWALFFGESLAYLFFAVATILVSTAKHYREIDLKIGDLFSLIATSWNRVLVTFLLQNFLDKALDFIFITPKILSIIGKSIAGFYLSSFILKFVSPIFYYYISVVFDLALVISVVEKKSGFEALAKASELVKGSKLKAILLYILFGCALSPLRALMSFVGNSVEDVLLFVSITVLYFQCKKIHGQEVGKER